MALGANGREIVRTLKGRWGLHSGTCRCPAHEDRDPSLSVMETPDRKVLVHCHAGCSQIAVIAALQAMGLWPSGEPNHYSRNPYALFADKEPADKRERSDRALGVWDAARDAKGTPVEAYLRARGIRLPLSDQLRYAAALRHSDAKKTFPAMIARLADNSGFQCVQRTYLDPREPRKLHGFTAKKTLGSMGSAAVRLRQPREMLGLAEGIETALAASQLYSLPVWATLSANRLSKIDIPESVKDIEIFADPGDVGRVQAFAAADHYERTGFHVEVIFPVAHFKTQAGADFADVAAAS